MTTPINLYFSFMVAYLHESLKKRGYSMLMMMEPVRSFSEELYLSVLSRNVDGILSFIQPEEELGGAIEAYGVPVVLVGRRSDVKNVDCIYTDDVKGGRVAAAYLADKGLKRIAFFSEMTSTSPARATVSRATAPSCARVNCTTRSCVCFWAETAEGMLGKISRYGRRI